MSATGRLLLSDHERLDKLFEQLLDDVHRGEWSICQTTWSCFERELLEHMDAEEKHLLPIFERQYPDETSDIREEHTNIRVLLIDLGVRLELHTVREQHARRLIELLKAHAAREEVLLYRWAKDLPPEIAKTLAQRCGAQPPTRTNEADRDGSL
jgi:hemerythrin superfamily protein